jgi:predicted HTH domain antitoxin
MAKLKLEIPDEVLSALKIPLKERDAELRKELALSLYQRGALSIGKARALAGMNLWSFEELLGQRRIQRHYTEEDLKEDIKYARSS